MGKQCLKAARPIGAGDSDDLTSVRPLTGRSERPTFRKKLFHLHKIILLNKPSSHLYFKMRIDCNLFQNTAERINLELTYLHERIPNFYTRSVNLRKAKFCFLLPRYLYSSVDLFPRLFAFFLNKVKKLKKKKERKKCAAGV